MSTGQPSNQEDERFVLIYRVLDDLKHAADVGGGRIRYDPPDADPLERLRLLLDQPESKWRKVPRGV